MAVTARVVGRRGRALGDAVPGARQRQHLVAAGRGLGHAQRRLVRFPARRKQEHPLEVAGRDLRELLGEVDHRAREQLAVEMNQLARLRADDGGDLGMTVAEDGAHLAGGEIEEAAAVGRGHERARGRLDDRRLEVVAVAHEMPARTLPQCLLGGGAHRGRRRSCGHGALSCRSPAAARDHRIWLRNARVRGSFASLKKVAGAPCSTITPRSVK